MRYILVAVLGSVLSLQAHSASWQNSGDDFTAGAEVLPRGRTALSFAVATRKFSQRLGSDGENESLGQAFTQQGLGVRSAYEKQYEIDMHQTKYTMGMLYGLTKNWAMGVRLPVVHEKSLVQTTTYEKSVAGKKTVLKTAEAQKEFNPEPNYQADERVQIGNLEFVGKYKFAARSDWQMALLQEMRFPSAESSPTDVVINPTPEASGYGLGLGVVFDYRAAKNWRAGLRAKQYFNLKDKVMVRGGSEEQNKLSRDPGDESELGVLVEYGVISNVVVAAGLTQAIKQKDKFANSDHLLGQGVEESQRQTADFSVGFLPNNYSRELYTLSAQLQYTSLLAGKNTEYADALTLKTVLTY